MSGEPTAEPVRTLTCIWMPAYGERELVVIWNDGKLRGLRIDGVMYALNLSPGLRYRPGDWPQTTLEQP